MFINKRTVTSVLIPLIGVMAHTSTVVAAEAGVRGQVLYPKKAQQSFQEEGQYFTGRVQVDRVFPVNDHTDYSAATVTFQPGARTAWHTHPAGQHMIVISGVGLTGTRDGKIIKVEEGSSLWCPPSLDHWHGATADKAMAHLVITGSKDGQNVIWKEKVSDAEYAGGFP